jgi:RNA polymerase sigma-70 factor, ECF subfamily
MNAEVESELGELMVAAQRGDGAAYASFLKKATSPLRSFLERKMKSSEHVDDVLQDTLIAIHKARHTYLPERSIGAWMFTICEHRMLDFYRRFRRIERAEVDVPAQLDQVLFRASEEASNDQRSRDIGDLEELFKFLSSKQRLVIELLKLEGLSVKEVASKTGMSESSVKVTAFRGYEALRKKWGGSR